jgi:hypothetical protein
MIIPMHQWAGNAVIASILVAHVASPALSFPAQMSDRRSPIMPLQTAPTAPSEWDAARLGVPVDAVASIGDMFPHRPRIDATSPYIAMSAKAVSSHVVERSIVHDRIPGLSENVNIYAPRNPGRYPLILFYSGFGSNIPDQLYGEFLQELAAKGAGVIVGLALLPTNPLALEDNSQRAMRVRDWASDQLNAYMHSDMGLGKGVHVDVDRVIVMGHSSGCQLATKVAQAPELQNFLSSLVLLDPVDGDPLGLTSVRVMPLPKPIPAPILFVVSGLGSVPGIPGIPSCCPPALSGDHFWNGAVGSTRFFLNATYYGHAGMCVPSSLEGFFDTQVFFTTLHTARQTFYPICMPRPGVCRTFAVPWLTLGVTPFPATAT